MTLYVDDENPCPEGAVSGFFTTSDGVELRYARWRPKKGCRGTISLFHGRTEFIEKYFEVVEDLLELGFAVATFDWRGQGGSERQTGKRVRGHVRRFADYDLDLRAFIDDVVLPDTPGPHFAIGHSMGGHILLRNARRSTMPYERIVLSAPLLQLPPVSLPWPLVEFIAGFMTAIGLGWLGIPGGRAHGIVDMPFEGNPLTHDETRFNRYQELVRRYPQLEVNAPTFAWLNAALKSMALVNTPDFAREITVPILIVAAGEDRVVSTLALEDYGAQLKAGHTVRVPRASHELMMEDDGMREQFFAAFKAFIPGEPYFNEQELALIGRKN